MRPPYGGRVIGARGCGGGGAAAPEGHPRLQFPEAFAHPGSGVAAQNSRCRPALYRSRVPRRSSRRLLAATIAGVLVAGTIALGALPASALPAAPSVVQPPASTPLRPSADALAARAAVAAKRDVVLIAHTGTAKQVAAAGHAVAATGLTVTHRFASLKALSVEVPKGDAAGAKATLLGEPGVESVEQGSYRYASSYPVDDPDYSSQAAYYDAIDAPAAWAAQTGSTSVRIAIIDTGVDVSNPDLAGKVDLTYNAVTKQTGAAAVTDAVGHGTFVAGVAAADTANDVGVAGAGYNTHLMAIKVASSDGSMSTTDEVAGIQWAVAHGANVINISLGGTDDTALEEDAIEKAVDAGVVVVAAAGNDATTVKSYPAAYPGVIAVGATDGSSRASFSNYGSWVTVGAPGTDIFSTTPVDGSQDFPDVTDYALGDGTSFSSPLVAGEAALLKAQNPSATGADIRAAIVQSARGFASAQLGSGRVDFAAALADLAPESKPTAVSASGTGGVIQLHAASTAARVQFAVDGVAVGKPVAVTDGTVGASWTSWGAKNGDHVVTAADCSSVSACDPVTIGARGTSATFTIANAAPTVAVAAKVTGRFTVSATTAGGALRFLLDGKDVAVVRTAPFTYSLSGSSLKNGSHTVRVVQCGAGGSPCAGPSSPTAAFTAKSLHPTLHSASHRSFSPNGDHVKDTTTISWTLPDTEDVQLAFVRPDGTTVRTVSLGRQKKGTHSWAWKGTLAGGKKAANGTYLVRLLTAETISGTVVRGAVDTTVALDTHRPKLTKVSAGGATFYPAKDGYRDTFAPAVVSSQPAKLRLVVRSSSKAVVRTMSKDIESDRTAITWNGRTAGGTRVPAGAYTWRFTATDAAGNVGASPWKTVHVSAKHLVRKTATIETAGHSYSSVSGTEPSCATMAKSRYAHGVLLKNACSYTDDGTQIALAEYRVTLPKATSYTSLVASVHGYVAHPSADLAAVYSRTDSTSFLVPTVAYATSAGTHTVALGTQSASHVVGSEHAVKVGIAVGNVFVDDNASGLESFDIQTLKVVVTYRVLR
jgi:subtilisin family serine protease/flagellar hook assembly protein FlgD